VRLETLAATFLFEASRKSFRSVGRYMFEQEDAVSEETRDIVKPNRLNERAVAARQSEIEEKSLIEEFLPFLNARISKYTAPYNAQTREDALSIAMMALHEAIQKYDVEKGHFFPFADRVVRARLIDYIRKISKQERNTISLNMEDDYEQPNRSSMISIASLRNYDEEQRRARLAEEIEQFKAEIATWGITMETLTKGSPKHKELRKTYKEIISTVRNCPDILQTIYLKRYFPVKAIAKITGLPQKKLERARIYIIAALIIKAGDYEQLAEFIGEGGHG